MAKLAAKVYSDAIFALAKERECLEEIYADMLLLKETFSGEAALLKILDSPRITEGEKEELLEKIYAGRISSMSMGLLKTILAKGRQNAFVEIFSTFIRAYKEDKGIGTAYITSANELSADQKEKIRKKLLETTEYKQFEMQYMVDESLIGGLIIRIHDRIVDSSIKTRIQNMKRELSQIRV